METEKRGRVVLASGSPRRSALLAAAGYDVEVRVPGIEEIWPEGSFISAAETLAIHKITSVHVLENEQVIAADTIVVLGEDHLEKPRDAVDAKNMLFRLSGQQHQVITGYAVCHKGQRRSGAVVTDVWFRKLSSYEIDRYLATDEPWDKAGSYGIQGLAGAFVERLVGSYTNVMGLPLAEVIVALEALS